MVKKDPASQHILMVSIFEGGWNGKKQNSSYEWRVEAKLVSMSYL